MSVVGAGVAPDATGVDVDLIEPLASLREAAFSNCVLAAFFLTVVFLGAPVFLLLGSSALLRASRLLLLGHLAVPLSIRWFGRPTVGGRQPAASVCRPVHAENRRAEVLRSLRQPEDRDQNLPWMFSQNPSFVQIETSRTVTITRRASTAGLDSVLNPNRIGKQLDVCVGSMAESPELTASAQQSPS